MTVEKPNEDLVEFHKDQIAQLHPGTTERAFCNYPLPRFSCVDAFKEMIQFVLDRPFDQVDEE